MTIGTRSQFQAAIDRATALGGARLATPLGDGRYAVIGRRGDEYVATVDRRGEWQCSCAAGRFNRPCLHQAAAWLKHLGVMTPAAVLP